MFGVPTGNSYRGPSPHCACICGLLPIRNYLSLNSSHKTAPYPLNINHYVCGSAKPPLPSYTYPYCPFSYLLGTQHRRASKFDEDGKVSTRPKPVRPLSPLTNRKHDCQKTSCVNDTKLLVFRRKYKTFRQNSRNDAEKWRTSIENASLSSLTIHLFHNPH